MISTLEPSSTSVPTLGLQEITYPSSTSLLYCASPFVTLRFASRSIFSASASSLLTTSGTFTVCASSPVLRITSIVVCFSTLSSGPGVWLLISPSAYSLEGSSPATSMPRPFSLSSSRASSSVMPRRSGTFTVSSSLDVPMPGPLNSPTAFPTRNRTSSAMITPATIIRMRMIFFVSGFTSFFFLRLLS